MWRKDKPDHRTISGEDAEYRAGRWLEDRGLELVTRNFRCKLGEIDLLMRDGPTLVFVEVRYRKRHHFGGSLESVDRRKQQKLLRTAEYFLALNRHYRDFPCRFDVMAASPTPGKANELSWQWVKNAFGA